MTPEQFINRLGSNDTPDFEDTMNVISEHYTFAPTKFSNGSLVNEQGQNEGSCKVFAFADLHNLSQQQTLACFGRFYQDVLNTPDGSDHGNIRNFMNTGWDGIKFDGVALQAK